METPEIERSPYAPGGSALADSARNLARTLQRAPEGETGRAGAFRRQLTLVAEELAEHWSGETAKSEGKQNFGCHRALWKLRDFTVELGQVPGVEASGIRTVLEALRARFLPDALLTLR